MKSVELAQCARPKSDSFWCRVQPRRLPMTTTKNVTFCPIEKGLQLHKQRAMATSTHDVYLRLRYARNFVLRRVPLKMLSVWHRERTCKPTSESVGCGRTAHSWYAFAQRVVFVAAMVIRVGTPHPQTLPTLCPLDLIMDLLPQNCRRPRKLIQLPRRGSIQLHGGWWTIRRRRGRNIFQS